jgi:hypothetical protein
MIEAGASPVRAWLEWQEYVCARVGQEATNSIRLVPDPLARQDDAVVRGLETLAQLVAGGCCFAAS